MEVLGATALVQSLDIKRLHMVGQNAVKVLVLICFAAFLLKSCYSSACNSSIILTFQFDHF